MSNEFKINYNEHLKQCDSKDVISFKSDKLTNISKFQTAVHSAFNHLGINSIADSIKQSLNLQNSYSWFREGEECEILRAGSSGWQKGKIKINVSLEFIPDEPEVIE